MKAVTIAEFKRQLPSLLDEIAKGNSILLQKGHRRDNIAVLSPYKSPSRSKRRLGFLARRGKPTFKDWHLSEEEFLSETRHQESQP